jgi:hypothetical protein
MSGITDVDTKSLDDSAEEFGYHGDTMQGLSGMLAQEAEVQGNFWGNNPEDEIAQLMQAIFPATISNLIQGTAATASNLRGLAQNVSGSGGLFGQSSVQNNDNVDAAVASDSIGPVK